MIDYKKGISFNGLISYLGMALSIIGIFILIFSISTGSIEYILYSLIIVTSGIIMAIHLQGTLIDLEGKRFKCYSNFIIYKTGNWEGLENYNQLVLTKFTDNTRMNLGFIMSTDVRTKSYDLVMKGYGEPIIIKEFPDYQEARAFLKKESEILGFTAKDEIQERRLKLKSRPRR